MVLFPHLKAPLLLSPSTVFPGLDLTISKLFYSSWSLMVLVAPDTFVYQSSIVFRTMSLKIIFFFNCGFKQVMNILIKWIWSDGESVESLASPTRSLKSVIISSTGQFPCRKSANFCMAESMGFTALKAYHEDAESWECHPTVACNRADELFLPFLHFSCSNEW